MKTAEKIILIAIVILAAFLRFYKIDQYPGGLNADEASIGYNAYSMLVSGGRDEYGDFLPLAFTSFADFKPPLYFYLTVPSVAVFGLTEIAVRFPSALLGILTVLLLYFLVKELFPKNLINSINSVNLVALVSALLLAISPWHLQFSRPGYEANASILFNVLGAWLFLKALKKPIYFLPSAVSFAASLYTYHASRIFIPLLGLGLLFVAGKKLWQAKREVVLAVILASVLLAPLVPIMLSPAGQARFEGLSLFSDPGIVSAVNEARGEDVSVTGVDTLLFHNKPVFFTRQFIMNYLDHFRGDFLFITGDPVERSATPFMGALYLIELPLLLIGAFVLTRKFESRKLFPLYWIAAGPVAAALTFQTPSALRGIASLPGYQIVAAVGLVTIIAWAIKYKQPVKGFILAAITVGYLANFGYYLHNYYGHINKHGRWPISWEVGFAEVVPYVGGIMEDYREVIFTRRYDQPYILTLFYLKYDPKTFQQEARLTKADKFGFGTVERFGKFQFKEVNMGLIAESENTLFVATTDEISLETEPLPENATLLKEVYFDDGRVAFRVVGT